MNIVTLAVGQLQTNCYLVSDPETGKCIIIDPGDDANLISENILRQNLDPTAIAATHGHFDHILAANQLQMAFNIPFYIHQGDKKILNYMTKSARHWLGREIIEQPPEKVNYVENGDILKMGNCKLKIISTPGHSPGGICLFNNQPQSGQPKIAFVGDTIFKNGVGRTDFKYASSKKLQQSIKKIKDKLSGYTAHPGHGDKFTITN